MASGGSTSQTDDTMATAAEQLFVNLQVVSPSVGVNRPLLFPALAATTTIKQLKEKIREALPVLRPLDENQRLIHRGRALLRDTDTLRDIFGDDASRSPDQQTIHLVVRETHDSQGAVHTPIAATNTISPVAPVPAHTHTAAAQSSQHASQPFARNTSVPTTPSLPNAQPRMPSPGPGGPLPENLSAAFQQQHQNLTQWLNNVQREARARAIVSQNQRGRAQMGLRGIGDATNPNALPDLNGGRGSPIPTHTVYRETVGPNGRSIQVETVMRPQNNNGHAINPTDVQNILRGGDYGHAAAGVPTSMQRSASNASLPGRSFAQPGIPVPSYGISTSRPNSGRATPDVPVRIPAMGLGSPSPLSHPPQDVEVYILSSPDGPRAILMNNATHETYYSPRPTPRANTPVLGGAGHMPSVFFPPQDSNPGHLQQQQENAALQMQHQVQGPVHQQQQPAVRPLHPNNPPAAGIPPLLLQFWPHIWSVFRLSLFVWFFTTPSSSWFRWFTIITLAVIMFFMSTGVLNGVAEQAWRPVARHLENVLPRLDRPQQPQSGTGQAQGNEAAVQTRNPDPAQMAARLVEDQRRRETWITIQARRLERAGLLFLASIAPGVAERHIANLEAEARAEERRQRDAEAAAVAAAQNSSGETGDGKAETQGTTTTELRNPNPEGQEGDGGNPAEQEHPIAREQLLAL